MPYLGTGIGIYSVANVEKDDDYEREYMSARSVFRTGGLLRGGFEWRKFRLGLEYNFMSKSNLQDARGNDLGISVSNNYLGMFLGYYFSKAKWGK